MLTSTLRAKGARAAAAVAAAGLALLPSVVGGPSAGADPKQFAAFKGVGSDTIQDVANAFAGFTNGINYTPVQSSAASGQQQMVSFDATPANSCVVTGAGGPSFLRPNGSGNGRKSLSRALDGNPWPSSATAFCGGQKTVSGQIDFARSSGGPGTTGTLLTFIPFGRDGVSFAYYCNGCTATTTLTSAQLTQLYTSGPQTISGVQVVPCGIQSGSGTRGFWEGAVGVSAATSDLATATCDKAEDGTTVNQIQENSATALKAKGDTAALTGKQVIVAFSAASFIAQSNGRAPSTLAAAPTVTLGAIDALGVPFTGTAPNLAASSTFYSSSTYGRNVYFVVPTAKIGGLPSANVNYKTMFVGTSSAICQATTTINAFGFLDLGANCGTTTLQGGSE